MNYYGWRACGRNPVSAWLSAHPTVVGWMGSLGVGLVFWTLVILWLTE